MQEVTEGREVTAFTSPGAAVVAPVSSRRSPRRKHTGGAGGARSALLLAATREVIDRCYAEPLTILVLAAGVLFLPGP